MESSEPASTEPKREDWQPTHRFRAIIDKPAAEEHIPKYIARAPRYQLRCDLCGKGEEGHPELGPIVGSLTCPLRVHRGCALWTPEVYEAQNGAIRNVEKAVRRGRLMKCVKCGQNGATIGCRIEKCPCIYHLPCALEVDIEFIALQFWVSCNAHRMFPLKDRHIYRYERWAEKAFPRTYRYTQRSENEIRGKESKKRFRKGVSGRNRDDMRNMRIKRFEPVDEDEEDFAARERTRTAQDLARIQPMQPDADLRCAGWRSVAGLASHIDVLKEAVILPLLYPEIFSKFGISPSRGILLHGHPGTGKTLVARALAAECQKMTKQKVAFFSRKGADCLGKFYGDAERELRLLFEAARKQQPAIIFFDEIDGLAPARGSGPSNGQHKIYASVVATLLALMDDVQGRGSVIVVGATNRPDAIDPSLRRPGRFDRELYFSLPSPKDRLQILQINTQTWKPKPSKQVLLDLRNETAGFSGADLQSLCSAAFLRATVRHLRSLQPVSGVAKNGNEKSEAPEAPTPIKQGRFNSVQSCMDNHIKRVIKFLRCAVDEDSSSVTGRRIVWGKVKERMWWPGIQIPRIDPSIPQDLRDFWRWDSSLVSFLSMDLMLTLPREDLVGYRANREEMSSSSDIPENMKAQFHEAIKLADKEWDRQKLEGESVNTDSSTKIQRVGLLSDTQDLQPHVTRSDWISALKLASPCSRRSSTVSCMRPAGDPLPEYFAPAFASPLTKIILSLENIEPLIQPLKALRDIARRLKNQMKNFPSSEIAPIEYLRQNGLVECSRRYPEEKEDIEGDAEDTGSDGEDWDEENAAKVAENLSRKLHNSSQINDGTAQGFIWLISAPGQVSQKYLSRSFLLQLEVDPSKYKATMHLCQKNTPFQRLIQIYPTFTISLPSIVEASGSGSLENGLRSILNELSKIRSVAVLYCPMLESWAINCSDENEKNTASSLWQQASTTFDQVINKNCYLIVVTTALKVEEIPSEILDITLKKRPSCQIKLEAPTSSVIKDSIPRIVNIFKTKKIRKLRQKISERSPIKTDEPKAEKTDGEVVGQPQMNTPSSSIDPSQFLLPDEIEKSLCEVCGSGCREDVMMLCGDSLGNGCSKGFHLYCLQPPVLTLPAEDWYCDECEAKGERIKAVKMSERKAYYNRQFPGFIATIKRKLRYQCLLVVTSGESTSLSSVIRSAEEGSFNTAKKFAKAIEDACKVVITQKDDPNSSLLKNQQTVELDQLRSAAHDLIDFTYSWAYLCDRQADQIEIQIDPSRFEKPRLHVSLAHRLVLGSAEDEKIKPKLLLEDVKEIEESVVKFEAHLKKVLLGRQYSSLDEYLKLVKSVLSESH